MVGRYQQTRGAFVFDLDYLSGECGAARLEFALQPLPADPAQPCHPVYAQLRAVQLERIKEDLTCNVKAGDTPAQALKHWTGNAGIVLKWSGPKGPYPTDARGTIKEGAYADLLLWDGNPLDNIDLILDESKLHFVMKDGMVYKNMVAEGEHPYFRPGKAPLTRGQYPL